MTTTYGRATESLRSTAKWLVTALTGAGLLSLAGFQANRLDQVSFDDHPVRLALAVLTLTSSAVVVGLLIWRTATIFTERWITLAELSDDMFQNLLDGAHDATAIVRSADEVREELYGGSARTVAELHRRLRESNERLRDEIRRGVEEGPAAVKDTSSTALALHAEVEASAGHMVDFANFVRTKSTFDAVAPWLTRGVIALVLLNVGYVLLTSPPGDDPPPTRIEVELVD